MSAADAPEPNRSAPAAEAEDLLEGIARGEREAVMALYDRFAPTLMAVALRVTASRSEAEDVLQDVFARVWREAATFDRARGTAAAWLVTLTRNRAIDAVRARKRRRGHEDDHGRDEPATVDAPAIYSPPVEIEQLPNPGRVITAALAALA